MADIKDIVDEFKIIATGDDAVPASTGMVGIESFAYDFPISIVNAQHNRKYPLVLLSKQHPFTYPEFQRKYRLYTIRYMVLDLYKQAEQKTTNRQTKTTSLENLAEQFLREFRKRSLGKTVKITTKQDWEILEETVTGESIERIGNDALTGIEFELQIRVFTDCDEGTFNF